MGKRVAAVLCSFGIGAVLCAPLPGGAAGLEVEGSIERLSILDDSENGYYGYRNVMFSDDLSTAAYFEYDGQTGATEEFFVVDVATNTKREIVLPRSSTGLEQLVALSADGSSALLFADWEGVEAGDADAGLSDAVLLDTTSGELDLLTGDLDDVSIVSLSMDGAGDTMLLAAYRSDTEGSFYLLDGGVLEELTDLAAGAFDNSYTAQLSADGSSLLYTTRIGFQSRWHLRVLASGDERVVAAPDSRPRLAADGSRVVARTSNSETLTRLAVWDTATTQIQTVEVAGGSYNFLLNGAGTVLVSAGYTRVENDGYEDYRFELARVDLATGERTVLFSNRNDEFGLLAVDDDGDRFVIQSRMSLERSFPVTPEEIYGGYSDVLLTYLVDLDGEPRPVQLPGRVGSLDDQMERLYAAYFDRAPDEGGLTFWREQRAGGRSLASVSSEFERSAEFTETYGDLGDEEFIDLVYRNVLDREPDAGGRAFWLDYLTGVDSRGPLMTLFSESPEFIENTGTQAAPLPLEAAVGRLYSGVFGRQPDPEGLAYWVSEAHRGVPLDDIAWYFMRTEEFQNLYGGFEFDPYAMLTIVYRNGMNRELDTAGNLLADSHYTEGRPIEELMVEVTNSPDFVAITSTTPIDG